MLNGLTDMGSVNDTSKLSATLRLHDPDGFADRVAGDPEVYREPFLGEPVAGSCTLSMMRRRSSSMTLSCSGRCIAPMLKPHDLGGRRAPRAHREGC